MDSETYCFEDDFNHRHFMFIRKTASALEWMDVMQTEMAIVKSKCNLVVYHNIKVYHHSDFYERESNSQTGNFIFLQKYINSNLAEIEKNVLLLYREGFSLEEVCESLDLKEGTLKKHNQNIFDKTGIRQMKKFAR